jgi:hypothetical protein
MTTAARAANSVRPAIVPDQLRALDVIDQGRQVDHLQRSHGSVPTDGRCRPLQQPNDIEESHSLLSDTMVAPRALLRQHPETQDEPSPSPNTAYSSQSCALCTAYPVR